MSNLKLCMPPRFISISISCSNSTSASHNFSSRFLRRTPPSSMEQEPQKQDDHYSLIPKPDWFITLLSFQSDIIYKFITTLFSPFTLLFSMLNESYRRTEVTTATVESTILQIPSKLTYGSVMLIRKLGLGIMGAVHVFVVLVCVVVLAGLLGFGLVRVWIEKPVFLRERLFFDYSEVNPTAEFNFGGGEGFKRGQMGIPVGHTFHASLELLMPESYYNREMGVFQLSAELLSAKGVVITKSSQPCMFPYRSLPIRLVRTCLMSIPLLLGISEETQKMSVEILKHREGNPRTKAVRVTLIPRAGTSYLPQLYEAEILMNSKLPLTKQLLRNWKWTISVWASLYIYITLLIFILCCCRPLLFPMTLVSLSNGDDTEDNQSTRDLKEPQMESQSRDQRELSDLVRKWQQRRRKRKAIFLQREVSETVGSSASSMSITREDTSVLTEEDTGDSESVCLGN
ncbi:seipin-1 [Mercurialis annua]|uniref:seipin-1 n=1 Tax=Mercurialis annua TaxID=3986 RepID=UPI00215F41D2|nr:seipin-1 [Mercurialis annua]